MFVGKKGAMKQLPLADIASDSAGAGVLDQDAATCASSTRRRGDQDASGRGCEGEKRTSLTMLDVDLNSPVIFSELGVYKFMGTLCDNI